MNKQSELVLQIYIHYSQFSDIHCSFLHLSIQIIILTISGKQHKSSNYSCLSPNSQPCSVYQYQLEHQRWIPW